MQVGQMRAGRAARAASEVLNSTTLPLPQTHAPHPPMAVPQVPQRLLRMLWLRRLHLRPAKAPSPAAALPGQAAQPTQAGTLP